MDGVGEWATTSIGDRQRQRDSRSTQEIHFPHSLGLLYSAFTYYTGFKVNSGEYKVMGLAPYGEPKYAQADPRQSDRHQAGRHRSASNMDYFDYCTGLTMTNERFDALFGGPPRKPEELLTQRDMDLAASIQAVTEEVVLRLTRALAAETGDERTCASRAASRSTAWPTARSCATASSSDIWIQPAAGDAGGALGAALAALSSARAARRARRRSARRDARRLSRARSTQTTRSRRGSTAAGARFERRSTRTTMIAQHRAGARRRAGGRLVPGTHGIRPARARRTLDPRRSAFADDAEDCSTSR